MGKTHGDNLRGRLIAAVDGGTLRSAAVIRSKLARRWRLPGFKSGAMTGAAVPSRRAAISGRTGARRVARRS